MCETLEIGLREEIFFKARKCFSKILLSIKDVKMNLRMRMKKHAVDLAKEFFTKVIFRPLVFTETTRQRGSYFEEFCFWSPIK